MRLMSKTFYGGQAVIEGVMMRGKKVYATAVRTPDGEIAVEKKENETILGRYKLFTYPIFRGMSAFVDSLIMGTKILMRSAVVAGEDDEEEPSKFEKKLMDKYGSKLTDYMMYFSVAVSMIIAILLFFLLPVFLGSFFNRYIDGTYMLGIIEGLIRIIIFLMYIFLISRMKEIKRVFEYHGAEHKTINCFESGKALSVENVKKCSRMHKRCGTSFLLIVMVVSMVVFVFVRTDNIGMRMVSRIVLVPFISGISYEIIKWAGRSDSMFVKIVSAPGMCLQKLTTSEPEDDEIECAVAALVSVLEAEEPGAVPEYSVKWNYLTEEVKSEEA
ncbi:hypothetical protein SDC9_117144 [bioreactor metagenome]|uniref:DUF1385 domain-containing protein n=1 Tax=bioreactor metagenome TaxID=1076179 RepID=A0A645BZS7_9ZZZZ|nr:DUF1385 domain-containing protein [Candidatus Metalachnospira sp.]